MPNTRKRGRPLHGPTHSAGSLFGGGRNAAIANEDPYPATLMRISAVLEWGTHADSIGGREADILADIGHAAREVLRQHDPASLHLIPQPEAN